MADLDTPVSIKENPYSINSINVDECNTFSYLCEHSSDTPSWSRRYRICMVENSSDIIELGGPDGVVDVD